MHHVFKSCSSSKNKTLAKIYKGLLHGLHNLLDSACFVIFQQSMCHGWMGHGDHLSPFFSGAESDTLYAIASYPRRMRQLASSACEQRTSGTVSAHRWKKGSHTCFKVPMAASLSTLTPRSQNPTILWCSKGLRSELWPLHFHGTNEWTGRQTETKRNRLGFFNFFGSKVLSTSLRFAADASTAASCTSALGAGRCNTDSVQCSFASRTQDFYFSSTQSYIAHLFASVDWPVVWHGS